MPNFEIILEHFFFLFESFFDTTQNFSGITYLLHKRKHWSEKGKDKTDKKETKVTQYCW